MRFLYKDTRLDEINIEEIKPQKRTSIKRQILRRSFGGFDPSVVSGVLRQHIVLFFYKNLKSFTVISQRQSTQNVMRKLKTFSGQCHFR